MNKDKPYTAIINIAVSVYPVDPTGELSGRLVDKNTLREHGIKSKLIKVKGDSYEECVLALKEKLDGFN